MDEHRSIIQRQQVLLLQSLQRIHDLLSTCLIGKLEDEQVTDRLNSFLKYENARAVSVLLIYQYFSFEKGSQLRTKRKPASCSWHTIWTSAHLA